MSAQHAPGSDAQRLAALNEIRLALIKAIDDWGTLADKITGDDIMRRDPQDWTFSRFDHRKHRSLEEARRRVGRRMWATVVACVLVPAVLVALAKGIL